MVENMTEKCKEPEIRFAGYTDNWKQRKVGELLTERNEQAPMSDEYPLMAFIANEGVAPKGERYDRSSLVSDTESKLYKKTEFGDFIYSSNNLETGSIGLNKFGNATISPVYSIFQPTGIADSDFLGRRLVKKDFINAMVRWRQGVIYGQWRIHELDFMKIEISVPSVEEQRKIGTVLNTLDNLITLQQYKVDKLVIIKKSMLQKMFPNDGSSLPEIRFKNFNDAWEHRKLSEIATMHARIGWQNLRTSEFLDNGDYMLITGTDFQNGAIDYSTCHYVERERYIQDRHIQITNGSILITKDGTLGKVAYVQGLKMPATLNAGVFNVELRDDNAVDGKYLFQFLKAPYLMDYVSKKATGGTIKHLNQNILVDFPVVLPNNEEQSRIGEFFFNLDNLITLHQRKLGKLKNIKRSLLDKMFVSEV
ncbi:MAG TPA: restriction endonuclease subunit S [Erysipelotrichaceae bacterium]|nr:restriction endonuclease subunit S [Erysipelotrichaceae bacterium]